MEKIKLRKESQNVERMHSYGGKQTKKKELTV